MSSHIQRYACLILIAMVILATAPPSFARQETIVSKPWRSSMFALYEDNRESGIGNHITIDFILSSYSLFIADVLTETEEELLMPGLATLAEKLLEGVKQQPSSSGREFALAYLGVLARLLDRSVSLPPEIEEKVAAELSRIADGNVATSAITETGEDFSQYKVRGKYDRSDALKRYFKAAMYAGRIGFHLLPSTGTGVTPEMAEQQTSAARILSRLIVEDEELLRLFRRLDGMLSVFVGPPDDLTPEEYAASGAADDEVSIADFAARVLEAAKAAGRLPRINSELVASPSSDGGPSIDESTAGMRLVGQRHTPESEAFQRLTGDDFPFEGTGNPLTLSGGTRRLPSVLDIPAGLGSAVARELLETQGDAAYLGFGPRLAEVSKMLAARAERPQSLGDTSLQVIGRLRAGNINAALGLWIRTRHDFILYIKQPYTPPKGVRAALPSKNRGWASIDPEVAIYEPLIDACTRISAALGQGSQSYRADTLRKILTRLSSIADHQRTGKRLSKDDVAFLNEVDRELRAVAQEDDSPVVADLHTDPEFGFVLQAGVGFPVAETRGSRSKTRGARFTCYQFRQPLNARLTDDEWQQRLATDDAPSPLKFGNPERSARRRAP